MTDPITDAIAKRRAQLAQQTGGLPAVSIDAAIAKRKSELEATAGREVVSEVGDGIVYRNQDGSLGYTSPGYSTNDRERIVELMRGKRPADLLQGDLDRERIDQYPVASRANEVARGFPFAGSYTDEMVGMYSPNQAEQMRLASESMMREKPGQTAALNMLGGVVGSAPLAVAAAPSVMAAAPASTAGRIGAGILGGTGAGATEGAIWGFGEGRTVGERARNAGQQGAIGGIFGGVLGGALPIAGDLFEAAARRYKGEDVALIAKEFGISTEAATMLRRAFANNDLEAGKRIMMAGPDATLADAGRSGQALLDAAAQTGGKPLNIVSGRTEARAAQANRVLGESMDEALGPVRGPLATAREISTSTRPARKAAYDAAYSTPIDYASAEGRAIEDVLSRLDPKDVTEAVRIANRNMRLKGETNMQIMAEIADDGSVRFVEMPNVQQLDQIKRALDDMGSEAVDNFGRKTADGNYYAEASDMLRKALIDATGGPVVRQKPGEFLPVVRGAEPQGGTYARALAEGQGKISMDRGLQLGLDMLRKRDITREAFAEQFSALPRDAQEMVKAGLRSHIDDTLSRVNIVASDANLDAREAMQSLRMLTSRDAMGKLGVLLGKDARPLVDSLNRAQSAMEMRASVARNSATGVRQAIQAEGRDIMEPGLIGKAARGQPVEATQALTQRLMGTTPADDAMRSEAMWTDIADVLTQRRGDARAMQALEYVEKALSGQPLKDRESKLIANVLLTGLTLSGSRAGNQALTALTSQ